jgi:AcrR family transcriptional regulator
MMTVTLTTIERPMRADARRNYERLLDAARTAFAEHGPNASLDDIAHRAGVGPGTLYRHFPTRFALQEAVVRDRLDTMRAKAEELLLSPSPGEALGEWLRLKLSYSAVDRGLGATVEAVMLDRGTSIYSSPACTSMKAAAEALLIRAQESGDIRADIDSSSLLRLVNGISLAAERAPDPATQAEQLLAIMLDGLRPQNISHP